MTFNLRQFILVFFFSFLASFLTFFVIQYFQGEMEEFLRIAGKAFMVSFALALFSAIPRRRKDYPWQ